MQLVSSCSRPSPPALLFHIQQRGILHVTHLQLRSISPEMRFLSAQRGKQRAWRVMLLKVESFTRPLSE